MSKRNCITARMIGDSLNALPLEVAVSLVFDKRGEFLPRKRIWAAIHNQRNKRKHKWTWNPNRFETTK